MSRTLLRGAQVITMAPGRPDAECVDILVEGDRIAMIGEDLDAPDAEPVDLTGRVVIPGLVNAHLHTWQTGLRSVGADWTLMEYLTHLHGGAVQHYRPDDMYISNLAGALNQINCGTTTLGDWCHNSLTPEHADAAVEGLVRAGIRAVFLHGTPYRDPDLPHPLAETDRLLDGPVRGHALLTLGMAVQGPQYSSPNTAVADFRAAAERGLVVSLHQSGGGLAPGWDAVRDAGLFSPHTNVVHGSDLPDGWMKTLVEAGVTFTSTPENELGQGHGTPVTGSLLRLGGLLRSAPTSTPSYPARSSPPPASPLPTSAASITLSTARPPAPSPTGRRSPPSRLWSGPPSKGRRRSAWPTGSAASSRACRPIW